MKPPHVDWRSLTAAVRARLPMTIALLGVAAVWALGAWWSFTEQRAFAGTKGFADPALLPLVIDGFAVATACVAFAASLDGRPAVPARLGTAVAVAASAASNGWWAAERSTHGGTVDLATVVMGIAVPIFANIAFEVLLAELRRQVQRARGLPAPAAVPTLRIVRLLLAPADTFKAWRRVVLELTAVPEPDDRPARDTTTTSWDMPGTSRDTPDPGDALQEPLVASGLIVEADNDHGGRHELDTQDEAEDDLGMRRCSVYRVRTSGGRLLYVGKAVHVRTRLRDHQKKDWWDTAHHIDVAIYATEQEALMVEAIAIATERPEHNIAPGLGGMLANRGLVADEAATPLAIKRLRANDLELDHAGLNVRRTARLRAANVSSLEDVPGRLTDADIVAALAKRPAVPGIGAIASEFSVGKGRAGRIKTMAEDGLSASQDDKQDATRAVGG